MREQLASLSRPVVLVLAVALLLVGYFWVHKPLPPGGFLMLGGAILDAITVFAALIACGTVGHAITRRVIAPRLDLTRWSRAEHFALVTVIGFGAVSTYALIIGLIGLYTRFALWLPLIALMIVLRRDLRGYLAQLRGLFAAVREDVRHVSPFTLIVIAITLLLIALALIDTFVPVYAWDGLVYHLVEPQRALEQGRLLGYADNFYLGFPKLTEMLFGLVMSAFGRSTSAALIHWLFGMCALIAIGGMARRYGTRSTGWIAVAIVIMGFNTWQLFGWSYVDLAVMAYAALAFSALMHWRTTDQVGWLALAGVLIGFGVGVKYTTGVIAIAFSVLIVLRTFRTPRRMIACLLWIAIPAVIVFAPWAIRAALLYGNPIFPYIFDGLNWDSARAEAFNQAGRGLIAKGDFWQVIVMPFAATILGQNYGATYSYTAGAWLLTLPFLFVIVWKWTDSYGRTLAKDGAVILLVVYVFWAITAANNGIAMQTRLMIAMFPVSAVLGAVALAALEKAPEKPIHMAFIMRAVFALTLIASAIEIVNKVVEVQVFPVMTGQIAPADFRFRQLASHPTALARLNELPAGSDVIFMYEPRNYDCPPTIRCHGDVLFDNWGRARANADSPQAVFAGWRDAGHEYVLVFFYGLYSLQQSTQQISYYPEQDNEFLAVYTDHLTEVWIDDGGRYGLFRIAPPAA
jgi:4-amino-4-deoxy-L-arabinose transferase-like glycosyltransferase